MDSTKALKPCPLCGGKAEIWHAHPENPKRKAWVACMDRCLVLTKEYDTTADAIEAWNHRPALSEPGEAAQPAADGYQSRVHEWMMACFNDEIAFSRKERNHRFLEEALELVQAMGCTRSEAYQLVDYVFDRPTGEPAQEVGGVIVCLAALCTAAQINMDAAGETELARIWTKVEKIRAKHAAKPQFSPLPGASPGIASQAEEGSGE